MKFGTPPKTYDEQLESTKQMLVDELNRTPRIFVKRRNWLEGAIYAYETAILFREYEKVGHPLPYTLRPKESVTFKLVIRESENALKK